MGLLPIRLMPIAYLVLALAAGGGLWWLVDAIGDRREEKVWRKINAAIDQTNTATAAQNEDDDRAAAIAERARANALATARRTAGGPCPLSADEAQTLARVR